LTMIKPNKKLKNSSFTDKWKKTDLTKKQL
jgi:hypothetical protein